MRRLGGLILFVLAGLGGFSNPVSASQSVELTWNPGANSDVVAYNVYYGTQSHQYSSSMSFGNVSDVIIPGLGSGQTYYFSVTAIDVYGNESDLSNEAVYTVPAPSPITLTVQGAATAWAADVSWTPSSDSGVYGYTVYYGTQSGVYNNSTTFYYANEGTIPGLAGGTTYYFVIAPIDAGGTEAVASTEVSYTVPNPVPIVLQAQMPANSSGVQLSWNAVPNEGILSYNVYYGTASGSYYNGVNCGNVDHFLVQGLQPGQTYYFKVSAVDAYGNENEFSSEASSAAAAPVPVPFQVQGTTVAMRAVSVFWPASTDSSILGYAVYYGTQDGDYPFNNTFFGVTNGLISGLEAGSSYYFAIAPINIFGVETIASSGVSYTVPVPQPIVLHAQPQSNSTGIELTWNAVPNEGVVGYNVYFGTQSGAYSSAINFGLTNDVVIQGLNGGQTYYFAVVALDAYGNQSDYSSEASATVPNPSPMILHTQTYTDGNGQPYAMEINTPSTVYGNWEMDCSTDLLNWTPYTYGYGGGTGDGYDVDAFVSIDPTQPRMFFRVINQ